MEINKKCNTCLLVKSVNHFHKWKYGPDGYKRECKECRKRETKTYYGKNSESIKKKVSIYRKGNPEKVKKIKKIIYERNKDVILNKQKNYYKENRRKIVSKTIMRRKNDPVFHLIHKMNSRLRMFLKSKNLTKRNKTFSIVGCSPVELKEHLERKFVDGMSWENRGSWHIDHIIPLSSAKTEDEIYELCHYRNLQPLWALDNIKKSNRIT